MGDRFIQLQKEFVNRQRGMFIHFNSATVQFQTGPVTDWEFDYENHGGPRQTPFDEKDWNPRTLDCAQWAGIAKSAGMTFAALTAKHHEGFGLWPSAHTDHCVKNASVQTDVVKQYLEAFRAEGLVPGLYFSILDIFHGIGRRRCTNQDKIFIKAQLKELLTGYGEIPFLIVDGWNSPWGGPSYEQLPFDELDRFVKGIQPDCLLMNIGETSDIRNTDIIFFENAAGQEIEASFAGPGCGCNIFTKQWFWRQTDPGEELKPAAWAAEQIEGCIAHGAAFLLNVSPNPDGRIDSNLAARYEETGKLLKPYPPIGELPAGWLRR